MGNKILRERLKGPALAAYYPRKSITIADIQKEFKRYGLETWNEEEEDRLEGLQIAKLRGKGAPKKKRTADSTLNQPNNSLQVLTISQQARKERRGNDQTFHSEHDYMIPCMKTHSSAVQLLSATSFPWNVPGGGHAQAPYTD